MPPCGPTGSRSGRAADVFTQNSKFEARNSKQIRSTKSQAAPASVFRISDLRFVSDFDIRISSFLFDRCPLEHAFTLNMAETYNLGGFPRPRRIFTRTSCDPSREPVTSVTGFTFWS